MRRKQFNVKTECAAIAVAQNLRFYSNLESICQIMYKDTHQSNFSRVFTIHGINPREVSNLHGIIWSNFVYVSKYL